MIILIGPDHTGKSRLAASLELPMYHFTKDSTYEDYLKPLVSLELRNAVCDRYIFCEYPYHLVMHREFKHTMKQWHNIILLTLIQKPLVVLCMNKPPEHKYDDDQYMPYDRWDQCLALYRLFLNTHHIPWIEYDYMAPVKPEVLLSIHRKYIIETDWWAEMWRTGYGCIGSVSPKVLLVAERLGPNNANNIPFETGPTGYMLTDMIANTSTPLNKVAITNLVKSFRRDTRPPDVQDLELLSFEIARLKPKKVVFMGTPARRGIKVAEELGVEHEEIVHLGYYNHKRIKDMSVYHNDWKQIMGIT